MDSFKTEARRYVAGPRTQNVVAIVSDIDFLMLYPYPKVRGISQEGHRQLRGDQSGVIIGGTCLYFVSQVNSHLGREAGRETRGRADDDAYKNRYSWLVVGRERETRVETGRRQTGHSSSRRSFFFFGQISINLASTSSVPGSFTVVKICSAAWGPNPL